MLADLPDEVLAAIASVLLPYDMNALARCARLHHAVQLVLNQPPMRELAAIIARLFRKVGKKRHDRLDREIVTRASPSMTAF